MVRTFITLISSNIMPIPVAATKTGNRLYAVSAKMTKLDLDNQLID